MIFLPTRSSTAGGWPGRTINGAKPAPTGASALRRRCQARSKLELQARHSDGEWAETVQTIPFNVAAPWWQNPRSVALVVGAGTLLIAAVWWRIYAARMNRRLALAQKTSSCNANVSASRATCTTKNGRAAHLYRAARRPHAPRRRGHGGAERIVARFGRQRAFRRGRARRHCLGGQSGARHGG